MERHLGGRSFREFRLYATGEHQTPATTEPRLYLPSGPGEPNAPANVVCATSHGVHGCRPGPADGSTRVLTTDHALAGYWMLPRRMYVVRACGCPAAAQPSYGGIQNTEPSQAVAPILVGMATVGAVITSAMAWIVAQVDAGKRKSEPGP